MKECKCVLCKRRTNPKNRRTVNKAVAKYLRKKLWVNAGCDDCICTKCLLLYQQEQKRLRQSEVQVPQEQEVPVPNDDSDDEDYSPPKRRKVSPPPSSNKVTVSVPSTSNSHAYCFVCKKPGPKLVVVPAQVRLSTYVDYNILIPEGCRCCPGHLKEGNFSPETVKDLRKTENITLTEASVTEIIEKLREKAKRNSETRLDFDNVGALSDADYVTLTGLGKDSFNDLSDHVSQLIRNTPARTSRTSLGIYLMKMNTGMSNRLLSTILKVSKSSIRRAISSVRKALMKQFVPDNLGFQHITRQQVIDEHTRPLAQSIFGDASNSQAILVLDGTYIYIQKSNNFLFQRRSYSLHKGRPLVKPMVVVTSSGYFVSVVGPYLADAKNNDVSILNHMLKTNVEEIKEWIHEDDVFIVDRGFRDSLDLLEDLGIRAKMPAFMKKGDRQMPTEDANASRLVTKVRWVVESANARIKRWKYLDQVLPTNQVPFIGEFVKIVCAISNRFFRDLSVTTDSEEDTLLAAKMLHLSKQVNSLKEYVEENGLDKQSAKWKHVSEVELTDFPELDEEQLRSLTCGTYQLKLSSSYMQEHVDGDCYFHIHEEEENLIRVRIQSRHVSAKTYLLWIRYNATEIESWYCRCRAGARVVGVCSHVASMLWFLGSARYSAQESYGVKNWGIYIDDAVKSPIVLDESDNESYIEE